jgi:hypothetical protein
VIYCFNPFGEKIMRQLVEKLTASLRADPRECIHLPQSAASGVLQDGVGLQLHPRRATRLSMA